MWCPNCKLEYRKGVTICSDCGQELVEGTAADFLTVDICEFKDEATADRFMEYLNYSGLDQAKKVEKDQGEIYAITVPEKQEKKAVKLFRGFILAMEEEKVLQEMQSQSTSQPEDVEEESADTDGIEEAEPTVSEDQEYDWDAEEQETDSKEDVFDENDEMQKKADNLLLTDEVEENTEDLLYTTTDSYTTKEEEYRDLQFSGLTFIIFSILGGIFLTLCQLEVLPIHYQKFIFIVIILVFVAFFVIGIVSMIKASKIKLEIPAEQEKTEEILSWLREELSQDIIDGWKDQNVTDVENDLLITSHIRASLIKKYATESIAYLEYIADLYYNEHYITEVSEVAAEDVDASLEENGEETED